MAEYQGSTSKTTKRYYYIKLTENFFSSKEAKVLRSQKNGAEYVLLWQQMLLHSVTDSTEPGVLRYNENIPYTPELLSTVTDTNVDIVRVALKMFKELGMIEVCENGDILIPEAGRLVGSETKWAEYKRLERQRKKEQPSLLPEKEDIGQSPTDVQLVRVKDIDKVIVKDEIPTENPNPAHSAPLTINQPLLKTMQTDSDVYTFLRGHKDLEREINALKKIGREYLAESKWSVRDYFVAIAQKKQSESINDVREILKGAYCAIRDDEDIGGWP